MGFMLVSFATFLIRPEYLAYLGLVGAALLLRRSTLRQVWRPLLFLLALLAALLCWKLWVFGEPLPTAFYRKLPGAATNGPSYVFRFFKAYALLWLAVAAALAIRPRLLRHPLAQGLLLACLANVLFVLRMQVLIGYGFRFLILPLMVAYGLVGVALCQGLQSLPFRRPGPWLAMAGLAFLAAGRLRPLPFGYPQAWNLASRARAAFERDPYMLFAEQLKKHLPEPERFTLVFGDAGTLPYALGCRYIDPNGLSEPAIARLFRLPDGPEKTGAFVARLFDPQPDMVILPLGGTPDARGNFILGHNAHDPFRGVIPEPYWLRLVEDGFLYACTLDLHYPVHVALRRSSPHFEALLEALRGYSDFHLPPTGQGGLLVLAPDFRIQLPGVDP